MAESTLIAPREPESTLVTPRALPLEPIYFDPPELSQYADRGDRPMSEWPGRIRTREDLMRACGDPRDWFRYGHRLEAYKRAWGSWADSRVRRKDFSIGFSWDQILIIGPYGSGKTTLGIKLALYYFRLGHAVFSNAACLFGWRLELEEMYTAMGMMPKNSVLLIDEGSAALSSRMGGGVAVSTFAEMNLNTRKQNCKVVYMTAKDYDIASSVRRETRQVWQPVPKEKMTLVGPGSNGKLPPAEDPDKFRAAWNVWDDYPYTKGNIIEGNGQDNLGFGKPSETWYDHGDLVRDAFALTDTFELAAAGQATVADKDAVKSNIRSFLGAGDDDTNDPERKHLAVLIDYIQTHYSNRSSDQNPEYVLPGQLSAVLKMDSRLIGRLVQNLGVSNEPRKGYNVERLIAGVGE